MWKRLQGWKDKLLSQAGREILIKSVIQAILTYTMSYFKLLKGLIKELKMPIQKFWWGYNGDSRKVHWVKWKKLCEAKDRGGMGFKDNEKFNDTLLAKQVWGMINNPDSLCHRVVKARFFPNFSILEAKDLTIGSYAWKSIISAKDVIKNGMVWHIGNGSSVRIKEDKRLPVKNSSSIISPLPSVSIDTTVQTLINSDLGMWKQDLVQQLFLRHEATVILEFRSATGTSPDRAT